MTETAVVKYDLNTATISKMASIYMGLSITDLENEDEFNAVHDARMVVKGHRVTLDKAVRAYNDQANAFKKEVKAKAQPLYDGLNPIESHLVAEEKKVTDEQKRIKEEADRKEREKIQARVNILQMYGAVSPFQEVAIMTDDEFDIALAGSQEVFEAERKRLADEEASRKAESERLAAERAELEKQRKEQEKKNAIRKAELDAIQQKISVDKAALEAAVRAEQERKDREEFERQAKIKAELDAIESAEIEKMEAELKAEAENLEAARQKALLPDKAKLTEWVEMVRSVPEPEIKNNDAKIYLSGAVDKISEAMEVLLVKIERL